LLIHEQFIGSVKRSTRRIGGCTGVSSGFGVSGRSRL
jgi:hypothetical protein